jgi:hypothetical protein
LKTIFGYIKYSFSIIDKRILLCVIPIVALLITLNYTYHIETEVIYGFKGIKQFFGFYFIYLTAFIVPYLIIFLFKRELLTKDKLFWWLLFVAPAIFAVKVSAGGWKSLLNLVLESPWSQYIGTIVDLPLRLCITIALLWMARKIWQNDESFWGFTTKGFVWQPYAVMLLCMIPLITFASAQYDFLHAYPKMKNIYFIDEHTSGNWFYHLLFEISYGLDFVSIELFFRGFLVIAFARYVGPDAILPMAAFYCSIHFGKPLLECISSFFGGFLLGCITYRTRSILGGLMVHLGIAWMMEVGGYLGNLSGH